MGSRKKVPVPSTASAKRPVFFASSGAVSGGPRLLAPTLGGLTALVGHVLSRTATRDVGREGALPPIERFWALSTLNTKRSVRIHGAGVGAFILAPRLAHGILKGHSKWVLVWMPL